jgi:MoaA/NifB/PqqE/SkfB family radical SAM enzyme
MRILRYLKNLIEINPHLSSIFDFISSTHLYKKIIYSKTKKTIHNIKKNKNYNIIIETTNFCNAQCIMCPHIIMKRSQKIMDDVIFNQIIHRIKQESIHPIAFILNGFGEPLIDPNIINRIKTIKSTFPQSKIKFYTNLNLANQKMIKKIISSGLDEINISLNGYNRQNYQKVMKIDYLETIKNLKYLIKTKQDTDSPLKIRISMTLVKHNENLAKKFIKKWDHLVDSVSVNKVHDYNHSVKNITNKFKINFQKTAFPCRYLFDTITFDVNGNIVLCCLDYESQHQFGNVKLQPILSSFYSSKFNSIRRMHLQNQIKKIEMCQYCYTPYKNGVEWLIEKLY